ncbi:polysaccharide biosynthesis/export family protein [Pseudodonghicola flavimaris]|uniref:Polysaccharide biosynthesis/export family protein n=1 Tax=Pseudodonghicola flavimaris TaxID=3050036 RepID=A0ABT7EZI5_9RHOB|nr:polysaccharide biosynthesis/export family protein [Pseudodonghicola flavimaris]MDK3017755.1 polysaccharide biosynthesis/export family protein [Pseudodonghicola flavimaris]
MKLHRIFALTTLILSACGVTYTSPKVRDQAAGLAVREVALTAETVLVANRSPYTPRPLPLAFHQNAGMGSGLKGIGALPDTPYVPEIKPEPLELRAPPQVTPPPYRIGIGDEVLLATKGTGSTIEELTGLLAAQNRREGYTVRDDGAIAIPDIGQIQIAGRTLEDAESAVFNALVERQIDPAFSLEVAQFNSKRVAVGGAVQSPRLVPITLTPLTLHEALTASGGISLRDKGFASIRIYRTGDLYQIPLQTYLRSSALQNTYLLNGDAVYVDTTYDLDRAVEFYRQKIDVINLRREARATALEELQAEVDLRRGTLEEHRSTFSSRLELEAEPRDYVYVTGEVRTQNRVPLPYEQQTSLADVLYGNGGFQTRTGDAAHIYVLRSSPRPEEFGAVTAWRLDGRNAATLALATRMQMRPNDIIFVQEQPITTWGRALDQFLPSLLNAGADAL